MDDEIKEFLVRPEGKGYGISLLVHAAVAELSLLVINHYPNKRGRLPLLVGQTEEVVPIREIDTRASIFLKEQRRNWL
ncbi:MAG: hypothetical protein R3C11_20595 [Planctomycetaceae bacterium]